MSKQKTVPAGSAAERILDVATDLFYQQGYRATGINEIIKKSGVAKATFYSHYPTKDILCLAYLKGVKKGEMDFVDEAIESKNNPVDRLLAVIESLDDWLVKTNYRGCAFLHMVSEVPDPRDPLRKVGKELYDSIRQRVESLTTELIESDPKKYSHLDSRSLTNEYMISFSGAVALSEIYHAIWPIEHALNQIRRLIDK